MDAIYIILAIPVFVVTILVELAWDLRKKRGYYNLADTLSCLSCGIGQQILLPFVGGFGLVVYQVVLKHCALFQLPMSALWAWVLAFLVDDFLYYVYHRSSHRVNVLWATHAVHHQSEEYNLSVALRQSWFTSLTSWIFYLPLAVMGVPFVMFVIVRTFNTLYQFWIHTRAVPKLGFLEWFLNTPSHHRVHHGINPRYIDKNHAGILIIWDRLLGTFIEEDSEPVYGTVKPLASFNPVWANFEEFVRLWQMSKQTRRIRDKIWIWFAPPEWRPADLGGVVSVPEITQADQHKYRVTPPLSVSMYTVLSFTLMLAAGTYLLSIEATLRPVYHVLYLAELMLGLLTISALGEGKPWAKSVELFRFASLLAAVPLVPPALKFPLLVGTTILAVVFFLLAGRQSPKPALSN